MQRILPLLNRLLLLALVVLVVLGFEESLFHRLKLTNIQTITYVVAIVYVLFVLLELVLNTRSAMASRHTTVISVRYLTRFFLFKKLMVNIVILAFALVSLYSHNATPEMKIFLLTLLALDIISFVVRLLTGHYRLMIEEYTFSIVEDQEKVVNAGRIVLVEFRYDIFFFKLKNDEVKELVLESIPVQHRKEFTAAMLGWLGKHNIPISAEGKANIHKIS